MGRHASDKGKKRPFCYAFSEPKVDRAWNVVGAVGEDGWVTCAALSHPKVRSAQGGPDAAAHTTAPAAAATQPQHNRRGK